MGYLWFILGALVLFFGFLALTALERKRGVRVFGGARSSLDTRTTKVVEVLKTADPLDFLVRALRALFGHVFHDIANVLWATVRMLERTLAGSVRRLRAMRHHPVPSETKASQEAGSVVEEKTEDRVG